MSATKGSYFLNLTEIADRWGMSIQAVLKLHVQSGRLRTLRHGKSHLVDVNDLIQHERHIREAIKRRIELDIAKLKRLDVPLPGTEKK